MRLTRLVIIAAFAVLPGTVQAESTYTDLDTTSCDVLERYEDGGAFMRCDGYEGITVYVSDGDARMDVDYGVPSAAFETFFAFNSVGEKIEWMLGADGTPYAAALRFHIDNDGNLASQALVVSKIGSDDAPGCVVGVVDAKTEQANGVARGLGALAPIFDCTKDKVVIVPGASELVTGFGGANNS